MFRNKFAVAIALMTTGMTGAYAADGTMHATGNVTESTCSVDVAGTTAQFGTIPLGSIPLEHLNDLEINKYGDTPYFKMFTIIFTQCPVGTQYKVGFSGTTASPYTLRNTALNPAGGASDPVRIGISDIGRTIFYKVNGTQGPVLTTTQADASLPYIAALGRNATVTTPGDLLFELNYTVNFL